MRCLNHIDMAVMSGAVVTAASAAFFFAYLGVEREPLVAPEPMSSAMVIQEELGKAIAEAVATPAAAVEEREHTQAALGEAIRDLTQVQIRRAAFVPELTAYASAAAQARREFLEGVFKLPADWRSAEFMAMERQAEALAQPELGRMIVENSRALTTAIEAAEEHYGRALLAASLALERAAREPGASHSTIIAAARALSDLAERTEPAPAPEVVREPSWGFGSIGDGAFIPIFVFGAVAFLTLAAGAGMIEGRLATRTATIHCDTHQKDVIVEMLVSDDTPYEVVRCSAFNGGPVTCDKHCLKQPLAHAA